MRLTYLCKIVFCVINNRIEDINDWLTHFFWFTVNANFFLKFTNFISLYNRGNLINLAKKAIKKLFFLIPYKIHIRSFGI